MDNTSSFINQLIETAVQKRAGNVYIEPLTDKIRVRFRIDGKLVEQPQSYPLDMLSTIVEEVKSLSLSKNGQLPGELKFTATFFRQEYLISASILPSVSGETVHLRIVLKTHWNQKIKDICVSNSDWERLQTMIQNESGNIFISGPCESGKSTTLYAILNELNQDNVKIITVENEIEDNIKGVTQLPLNIINGLTYDKALKSVCRQNPDVVAISEVTDLDTAYQLMKTALSGRLTISTMETNSVAASLSRFIEMGVESYLLAESTVAVISQRLVRKLCPKCKVERPMNDEDKKILRLNGQSSPVIYDASPKGCAFCNGIGYRDRVAVFEILLMTENMKKAITEGVSGLELQKVAVEEGMTTLKINAVKLLLQGLTSIKEIRKLSID